MAACCGGNNWRMRAPTTWLAELFERAPIARTRQAKTTTSGRRRFSWNCPTAGLPWLPAKIPAGVHAIDPDRQGQVLWQRRIGRGGVFGGIQWGPAADHNNVYVAISDVDDRRRLLPSGDSVRELNPFSGGGLFALDLATGAIK